MSGLFAVPDSILSSFVFSWTHNLSITALQFNGSNYAQWAKSVEVYFMAKKQNKFLIDNNLMARRLVKRSMRIGQWRMLKLHFFMEQYGARD